MAKHATDIAVAGLLGLAEKHGRPISEEAVIQASAIIKSGADGGTVSAEDVLDAVGALNPGELYTRGLEAIANTRTSLHHAAAVQTESMRVSHRDEHIKPTKQAYTFLTGKEF